MTKGLLVASSAYISIQKTSFVFHSFEVDVTFGDLYLRRPLASDATVCTKQSQLPADGCLEFSAHEVSRQTKK